MEGTNTAYLKEITEEVRAGQVLAISSWEGDDRWLRYSQAKCGDNSPESNSMHTISNITINKGMGSTALPRSSGGGSRILRYDQ